MVTVVIRNVPRTGPTTHRKTVDFDDVRLSARGSTVQKSLYWEGPLDSDN